MTYCPLILVIWIHLSGENDTWPSVSKPITGWHTVGDPPTPKISFKFDKNNNKHVALVVKHKSMIEVLVALP